MCGEEEEEERVSVGISTSKGWRVQFHSKGIGELLERLDRANARN